MIKQQEHTPLMQQYYEIKTGYPDALLLFQVGDFYELFFEDAKQAAACLGIALTSRGKTKGEPIPLCGVPVHALDNYLRKLIKNGFKVAICDQLEDPRPGSLVKRGVKQVLTPGTLTDAQLLDDKSASYLFSFYPLGDFWGLIFSELLTAQLFITTIPAHSQKLLETELLRFFPDEILLPEGKIAKEFQAYFKRMGYFTTIVQTYNPLINEEVLSWASQQFSQTSYQHICSQESIKQALYYFYAYMSRNQRASLSQFNTISFYKSDDFLIIDNATERNLELVKNAQDGSRKNTLFSTMDRAKTAMGSRMLKKWLLRPLIKKENIEQRQEVVQLFVQDIKLVQELEELLVQVGDLERVIGRIALQKASIGDYLSLLKALLVLPAIVTSIFDKNNSLLLKIIVENLGEFSALTQLLMDSLNDDDIEEKIIKDGFNERLDQMRVLVNDGARAIADLEKKEQHLTGISSLKIRYNTIQGYYVEITNTHRALIPERYKRVQTLVGRERFTTVELQQLYYNIENARKDINTYEREIFDSIKMHVLKHISSLRKAAHALAHIDTLLCLAKIAYDYSYVRPVFTQTRDIIIKDGRHPVVEQSLPCSFIPNDTYLTDDQSLWIVTGPNMGGKSTYLRQVALLCIMAHIGSFVPAQSAQIPILDRIFTRLGASDNVAEGKSTFLIEMEETATICTQATNKSLVILDEVGRGTSTNDGRAIAQAVVEYLFTQIQARCLFATHYHELIHLQNTYPGIVAYHAVSKQTENGIIFLYKMAHGVAHSSFGIEVAKLANLPSQVIDRASFLSKTFIDQDSNAPQLSLPEKKESAQLLQKNMQSEKVFSLLQEINFNDLSPKKAFDILWTLKDL